MIDPEVAQRWSRRMLKHDASYQAWAQRYSGVPDVGSPAPIWEVSPGAVVGGPVGYVKVDALEDLIKPWKYNWEHLYQLVAFTYGQTPTS